MMRVLYMLWLVEKHISGQSEVGQQRIKPVALSYT